jgi:hypothetical protein
VQFRPCHELGYDSQAPRFPHAERLNEHRISAPSWLYVSSRNPIIFRDPSDPVATPDCRPYLRRRLHTCVRKMGSDATRDFPIHNSKA